MGALKLSMKDVTVEKAESLVDQIQEVQGLGRVLVPERNCSLIVRSL